MKLRLDENTFMTFARVQETIGTYDQIADRYLERWRDRSAVHASIERFVELVAQQRVTGHYVLDVGCGPGFDAAALRQLGLSAIGVDLSTGMVNAGRKEFPGPFVQADMRWLPFGPGAGGLWVSASLLHLEREDVVKTLQGFFQTLVVGGILYLAVKIGDGAEWVWQACGQPAPRFFTYWQPESLDRYLKSAGFNIVDGWIESEKEATSWLVRFAEKPAEG